MSEGPKKPVVGDGARSRRSIPVDPAKLEAIHASLSKVALRLPEESRLGRELREFFRAVRDERNRVSRIVGALLRRRADLARDLIVVERLIQNSRAWRLQTNVGLEGATNDRARDARIVCLEREDFDAKAAIEEDLELVDAALTHARLVYDDVARAFDEGSRLHTSFETDWKIEGRIH